MDLVEHYRSFFAENEMVELTPELKELFDNWVNLTYKNISKRTILYVHHKVSKELKVKIKQLTKQKYCDILI